MDIRDIECTLEDLEATIEEAERDGLSTWFLERKRGHLRLMYQMLAK